MPRREKNARIVKAKIHGKTCNYTVHLPVRIVDWLSGRAVDNIRGVNQLQTNHAAVYYAAAMAHIERELRGPYSLANEKKCSEETQTLCAGYALAVVRWNQKFRPAANPLPGGAGRQNLISWRWSLPLPINPVW